MLESMVEYKWEVGTSFTYKHPFKEAVRTYVVHASTNLNFFKKWRVKV